MVESTTVTVGLDVHARSIRLAAVRADELLEERTLPYDEEAVERLLRRWPGCAAATRRARPASASTGIWSSAGSTARWWRRGWCRSGRVIGSRPIRGTRASSPACSPAGCSSRSTSLAGAGGGPRSGARPRGRAARSDARPPPAVEVLSAPRAAAAEQRLDGRSPEVALRAAVRARGRAAHLRHLPARGRSRRRADRGARAGDPGDGRAGPWRELVARLRCLRGIDTLTALGLVGRDRRLQPLPQRRRSSWPSSGWCPRSTPPASSAARGSITKVGNAPRAPAAGRGRLARAPPAQGRLRARPPPARPGRRS